MKKILSVILAIFIAIIPMSINALAYDTFAENPTIETTVDKETVNVGDIVTVSVKLPSNSKLCTLTYNLRYDSDTLSVVNNSENLNGAFSMEMINYDYVGFVAYAGISAKYVSDEGPTIFSIQFEVRKAPCEFYVSIAEAYEEDGNYDGKNVTDIYNQCSAKKIVLEGTNVPVEPEIPDEPEVPNEPDVPDKPVHQYSIKIKEPSTTTIRHRDGIVLHAVVDSEMPEGYRVEWSESNSNFKKEIKNDGQSLQIVSNSNGKTTFTASLIDADGNLVDTDTVEMNSKAGFFDKIGSFFRMIFGGTKIYEY